MMRNDHTYLDKGHHICNPISVKRPEDFSGKCVFTAKQLFSICKSELHKAVFRMPRCIGIHSLKRCLSNCME